MNQKQTNAFAIWFLKNQERLNNEYRESSFAKYSFFEFVIWAFKDTRFLLVAFPTVNENLIEIRAVVRNGMVENIYSNVGGQCFDVDVLDRDMLGDDKLRDQIAADIKTLERGSNRIF